MVKQAYATLIVGSGFFAVGYTAAHPDTLIIEEGYLADAHFSATFAGVLAPKPTPATETGKALLSLFEAHGLTDGTSLCAIGAEGILCQTAVRYETDIRFAAFVRRIERRDGGFAVSFFDNEGEHEVFARRVIDTRDTREKTCLRFLLREPMPESLPDADGFAVTASPTFFPELRLLSLCFPTETDIHRAEAAALPYLRAAFGDRPGGIVEEANRMGICTAAPAPAETDGILYAADAAFADPVTAWESGVSVC